MEPRFDDVQTVAHRGDKAFLEIEKRNQKLGMPGIGQSRGRLRDSSDSEMAGLRSEDVERRQAIHCRLKRLWLVKV